MSPRESVIEKVQKILALAAPGSGATEGERDAAVKMAQKLMFEHGIEMLELEEHGQETEDFVEESERIEGQTNLWRVELLWRISRGLGLEGFRSPINRKVARQYVIGRPDTVAFARQLYNHLIPWLELEADAALIAARERGEKTPCSQCSGEGVRYGRRGDVYYGDRDWGTGTECASCGGTGERPVSTQMFRRQFLEAASGTIGHRLWTNRREMEKAIKDRDQDHGGTGMELITQEKKRLDDYMKDRHPDLRSVSRGDVYAAGARAAGRSAGERADLSPGGKVGGSRRELNR